MEFNQAAADDDEPEAFDCLPRLPDIALRQIFSYLKFNDIKNCRQVCKQWHRYALDNVKIALVAGQNQPGSEYRPGEFDFKLLQLTEGTFEALETGNLFDCIFWQEASTSFQQFWSDIGDALLHKIRGIFFNVDCPGDQMHQLVQACVANVKSAELLRGFNYMGIATTVGFKYEREKSRAGQTMLQLRELDFRGAENVSETTSMAIMTPFFHQAESIRSVSACNLRQLATMLNKFQRNSNDNQPLVFPECTHLSLDWKSGAFASFVQISTSFYNVVNLKLHVAYNGNFQQFPADFGSQLQRLSKLKHLKLHAWITMQLPELRLPNVVSLRLSTFILPANSLHFDSTSLEELEIRGCNDNMQRLASHARAGGLKRLTSLELPLLSAITAARHLPAILKAATQLKTLKVEGHGFLLATATCLATAVLSKKLESLQIGEVTIPREVSSSQFVQEVVTWHRTIGLQAPLSLTCRIGGRGQAALATLIDSATKIDVDGTSVKLSTVQKFISSSAIYDMAWRNSNGIQQKLRIQALT